MNGWRNECVVLKHNRERVLYIDHHFTCCHIMINIDNRKKILTDMMLILAVSLIPSIQCNIPIFTVAPQFYSSL